MPPRKQKTSMSEIAGLITDNLSRAAVRPSIHKYQPHEKQQAFHRDLRKRKLYIGGNRSGKTVGGIAEDIMWVRGKHPYRELPVGPIRGRIVTVSYTEGIQGIIIPELTKWLPPSDLIDGSWEESYNKSLRTLTLNNGSTIQLMSYDQDVLKFAGTSMHFIHYDEEPPKPIFDECKMRLMDTGGSWWMTLTPVNGMSWVYFDIYEPKPADTMILQIDTDENPYLSKAEIEHTFSDMTDDEQRIRRSGQFIPVGGLVFKKFNPLQHIIDKDLLPPPNATQYMSLDHGYNAPTAWLWHYVTPDGTLVTYDELYANETLVSSFAAEIHRRNALPGRRPPDLYIGDPAISQRNAQTGDSIQVAYQQQGISIMLGNNDVKIGVEKMNRYFEQNKWYITSACGNLRRELLLVRWKVYDSIKRRDSLNPREEIHKKNDHAPDSARYLFSVLPVLYMQKLDVEGSRIQRINQNASSFMNAVSTPVGPSMYDHNVVYKPATEWTVQDEHLGGLW